MATLQSFINAINIASQATQAATVGIQEIQAGDTAQGITQIISVAGASAMASTSDTSIQAEIQETTTLALSLFPIFSMFIGLFKKKAPAVPTSEAPTS